MIERPRNLDINLSEKARPFNEAPFSIFLGGFRQFLRKRPKQSSTMEMRLTLERKVVQLRCLCRKLSDFSTVKLQNHEQLIEPPSESTAKSQSKTTKTSRVRVRAGVF